MIDIESFSWAEGQDSNKKEPIEALKKYGWRYGDVPTASNFNWIFNKIAETFKDNQKVFDTFKEALKELNILNTEQGKLIKDLQTELTQIKSAQDNLAKGVSRAIFTLNSNDLNTKLSPIYPFNDLKEPLRRCTRCNGYHDLNFDCHQETMS